jgi:HEPN domain-containing protein
VGDWVDKLELIAYWKNSSDQDFTTMQNLYTSKDYHWCLFIGHLVIEKLLKSFYVKNTVSDSPPKTHDLVYIAEKAGLKVSEQQKDILDLITTFNISARYPDYKQSFYNKCTEEYTLARVNEIKELRLWLISVIEQI